MKKVLFVCLALVLALVSTGVAYSLWSSNLTISGVVESGEVNVEFVRQVSNDAPPHGDPSDPASYLTGSLDPSDQGNWWCATEEWFDTPRWDKNVGSTDCEIDPVDGKSLTVTVDNGYPGYHGGVCFVIRNTGTVPVKLLSLTLDSVSYLGVDFDPIDEVVGTVGPIPLMMYQWYYVDDDVNGQAGEVNTVEDADDAYRITLDGTGCGFFPGCQIEPGGEVKGQIVIGVLQPAQQDYTYDFEIGMQFAQWNEVP